jgi:hypothetical protein
VAKAFELPPFPELAINPDILPVDPESRTFADIRLGSGLVDWEPYELEMQKYPILEVSFNPFLGP